MKVPFPSVSSDLAVMAHMYIVINVNNAHYEFVKWDASLEDITGTTVIRGIYKIVEN